MEHPQNLFPQNPFGKTDASAAQRWQSIKRNGGKENEVIDKLMKLKGLKSVKHEFLNVIFQVTASEVQGHNPNKANYNAFFLGNPGTGKTSVARLYGDLLASLGIIPESKFVETSGVELASSGPSALKKDVEDLLQKKNSGGLLFVDESYQMLSDHRGKQVLDLILKRSSDKMGRLVVVFAGYKKEMEPFFQYNPGLDSRIPRRFEFANFSGPELWELLTENLRDDYKNMQFVNGDYGLEVRIAVERLLRRSSERSFGNAREVQNCVARMHRRQLERLFKEGCTSYETSPEMLLLTRDDILGPPPDRAFKSQAWEELKSLVGLSAVKKSIESLIKLLQCNYEREIGRKELIQTPLNRVLVGQPGTGKTTVARLYGQILADLGLLSRNDVVLKTPADFIGSHVGESEKKTMEILDATLGKVLVIDEAYMLDDGSDKTNSFKASVIDTIVANVQGESNEDRCILLLGYEDKMRNLMDNMNEGLSRRFRSQNPWRFANFDQSEMSQILERKRRLEGLKITDEALNVARSILARASTRPHFANAAEVDDCLAEAKERYIHRLSEIPSNQSCDSPLEPEDFDPDLKRRHEKCHKRLEGKLGEKIIKKLAGYESIGGQLLEQGLNNPYTILPNMLAFKGSSGTGKTTAAESLSRIYYNLGILSSPELIQTTATDFIAKYVGQTAPKTRTLLQKALGKVLLIDGACGLNQGQYGTEAVDELIQFISGLSYPQTMIIILADSTDEINGLFKEYPSLKALFEEEIVFEDLLPDDCIALLDRELEAHNLSSNEGLRLGNIIKLRNAILQLQQVPIFQNARDIKRLARNIAAKRFELQAERAAQMTGLTSSTQRPLSQTPTTTFKVTDQLITRCVHEMTEQRRRQYLTMLQTRTEAQKLRGFLQSLSPSLRRPISKPKQDHATESQTHRPVRTQVKTNSNPSASLVNRSSDDAPNHQDGDIPTQPNAESLHKSTDAAKILQQRQESTKCCADEDLENSRSAKVAKYETVKQGNEECNVTLSQPDSQEEEVKKRQEEMQATRSEEEEEKAIQQKVQELGNCVLGYKWEKVGTGYRCAGGSHFMERNDLLQRKDPYVVQRNP